MESAISYHPVNDPGNGFSVIKVSEMVILCDKKDVNPVTAKLEIKTLEWIKFPNFVKSKSLIAFKCPKKPCNSVPLKNITKFDRKIEKGKATKMITALL